MSMPIDIECPFNTNESRMLVLAAGVGWGWGVVHC